jgi:hypothetical protein
MASLGFYVPGFFENASVEVIKSIRKFYPDSSIIISSDAGPDYYNVAKQYNCQFQYYNQNLGYPEMPHGYKKDKALEWLKRFYIACLQCKETHIMCAEDDIAIINTIPLKDEYEIYAHGTYNNYIPPFVLNFCKEFSGNYPVAFYGAGGGTIYKVDTLIQNYHKIVHVFDQIFDQVQETYPTFGWYDCYMTIYYFLCGKEYTINPGIFEIKPANRNFDLSSVDKEKYEIVHLFKNFYP